MFEKLVEKFKNFFSGDGFMDDQTNEDIKLITDAFWAIDKNKPLCDELSKQDEGEYDEQILLDYK